MIKCLLMAERESVIGEIGAAGVGGHVMQAPEVPAIHRRSPWQDKPSPNNPQLAANHSE